MALKRKERIKKGLTESQKNTVYLVIFLGLALGLGILIYSGSQQSIIQGQNMLNFQYLQNFFKPPPPSQTGGLASILIRDMSNGSYVSGYIDLYFYDNETYYMTIVTNSTILLNASTYGLVNISTGYYPVGASIEGSGSSSGEPKTTTLAGYKYANPSNISITITSIDGNNSLNYVDNITNGFHNIEFRIINNEWDTQNSFWGVGAWLPREACYPIANSTNKTWIRTWINVNGTINNSYYRFIGSSDTFGITFENLTGWCNSTSVDITVMNEVNFVLSGDFYDIKAFRFNDFQIDNITNRYIGLV